MAFQPVKPVNQAQKRYQETVAANGGKPVARLSTSNGGIADKLPATAKLSSQVDSRPFYLAKSSAMSSGFASESASFVVSNGETFPPFGRSLDQGLDTRLTSQIGYSLKT